LVQGFFTHALAGTSILLLILVTYERYTLLVLDKRMSKERALKLIALVYGVGVVYGLPPLLGLGHYDLSGGTLCIARGGRGVLTDNIYTAGGMLIIFLTTSMMLIGYTKIYKHISQVLNAGSTPSNASSEAAAAKARKILRTEKKILKAFVVFTAFFIVCWTTAFLKFFCEGFLDIEMEDPVFTSSIWIGGASNAAFNPAIYGLLNKNIGKVMRENLSRVLPCIHAPSAAVTPSPPSRRRTKLSSPCRAPTAPTQQGSDRNQF
jgi:hypothetical protein